MSLPEAAKVIGLDWARRWPAARSMALLAALALPTPMLSGCGGTGVRPLYGDAFGANVDEKLAAIEIAPIPSRVGQRIRNELVFQSTGGGLPQPAKYRLEIAMRESVSSTLVKTDGSAVGQVYNLDAAFRLINIEDKSVVFTGQSYGRAGFERFKSIFANVRAREDAENRAARTIGTDLKSRLAAFLATT